MNQNKKVASEKGRAASILGAGIGRAAAHLSIADAQGSYFVECKDSLGNVKWSEKIENLVTTVGKNDALDKYLSGSAYTAAWYLGLISSTGFSTGVSIADTAASHSGWVEDQGYSQGSRPTAAFSAAAAGSKSLSSALTFSITATTTIKGCFLMSNATKGGTTGILYSAGLFTGGDKSVSSGDTLNVSYSASL